ncbi:MAG TPA: hypothetical protein VK178_03405 [Opitutaceae bacterium]|nr:hypothetical protein [Opitutaceae bacterium]
MSWLSQASESQRQALWTLLMRLIDRIGPMDSSANPKPPEDAVLALAGHRLGVLPYCRLAQLPRLERAERELRKTFETANAALHSRNELITRLVLADAQWQEANRILADRSSISLLEVAAAHGKRSQEYKMMRGPQHTHAQNPQDPSDDEDPPPPEPEKPKT